jgi:hypothetical protein
MVAAIRRFKGPWRFVCPVASGRLTLVEDTSIPGVRIAPFTKELGALIDATPFCPSWKIARQNIHETPGRLGHSQ